MAKNGCRECPRPTGRDAAILSSSTLPGYDVVEFYRSLAADDLESGSRAGDLWVHVFTDFNDDDVAATNYLAGGIWVYVPDEPDAAGDQARGEYEFGAFATGGDPFGDGIAALTGDATYEGNAAGVYSRSGGRRNEFFGADVTLTARFDDQEIDGRVDNFVDADGRRWGRSPVLTLEIAEAHQRQLL